MQTHHLGVKLAAHVFVVQDVLTYADSSNCKEYKRNQLQSAHHTSRRHYEDIVWLIIFVFIYFPRLLKAKTPVCKTAQDVYECKDEEHNFVDLLPSL